MTEARYHELLGLLLDGSLSELDAEELRRELVSDTGRLRDVREHLLLSDLLDQELTPHRSADAFWRGVRSTLDVSADGARDADGTTAARSLESPSRLRYGKIGLGLAAGVLLALALGSRWSGRKLEVNVPAASGTNRADATHISLRGEAVCTHCVLHQTEECQPAVRVREGGREETLVLSDNAVCREFKRKRGCGRTPCPVLAEGTVRTENGRPLLVATRLEVQR